MEGDIMQPTTQSSALGKRSYTVYEIMEIMNIGKTTAYKLVHANLFHVVKAGSGIRISKRSFDKWFDDCDDPYDTGSF